DASVNADDDFDADDALPTSEGTAPARKRRRRRRKPAGEGGGAPSGSPSGSAE
ncbi:MAG: hypothetical protein I8H76_10400, partial [Burkholderiales bacterium]|nr:hypothetical protein [Burkholderiales bacterium]